MKIEQRTITPEMAEEMLAMNTANRPKNVRRVAILAEAMKRGEWKENGDTIRVSKSGVLLDGQHRLSAIAMSGVPQRYIVVSDLDDETFVTIDQGRSRTAGDVLATEQIKHYNAVAHAAKLLHLYEGTGNPYNGTPENAPTAAQIAERVKSQPEIIEACGFASRSKWLKKYLGAGLSGFLIVLFSDFDEDSADKFFDQLESGVVDYANSPVLLLRDRVMDDKASKTKMQTKYKAALVFKSFNAFCEGRKLKTLRVRTEGSAPEKSLFCLKRADS